jgi:cytochrome c oxidase assembly protein Cox11
MICKFDAKLNKNIPWRLTPFNLADNFIIGLRVLILFFMVAHKNFVRKSFGGRAEPRFHRSRYFKTTWKLF